MANGRCDVCHGTTMDGVMYVSIQDKPRSPCWWRELCLKCTGAIKKAIQGQSDRSLIKRTVRGG